MGEGPKAKQIHLNTTDDGFVANALVEVDATGKYPVGDGSQLTNLPATSFSMTVGGYLDTPALPFAGLAAEVVQIAGSLTTLRARRGVAGSSGTTTIVLELNGAQQAAATLSWTNADAANALKTVTFSSVAVAVGDRLSLALTSAEVGGQDIVVRAA